MTVPHIPKRIASVSVAVVSLQLQRCHISKICLAKDISNALNIEVCVDDNDAINTDVDVTPLLRTFASEGVDDCEWTKGGGEQLLCFHRAR